MRKAPKFVQYFIKKLGKKFLEGKRGGNDDKGSVYCEFMSYIFHSPPFIIYKKNISPHPREREVNNKNIHPCTQLIHRIHMLLYGVNLFWKDLRVSKFYNIFTFLLDKKINFYKIQNGERQVKIKNILFLYLKLGDI